MKGKTKVCVGPAVHKYILSFSIFAQSDQPTIIVNLRNV